MTDLNIIVLRFYTLSLFCLLRFYTQDCYASTPFSFISLFNNSRFVCIIYICWLHVQIICTVWHSYIFVKRSLWMSGFSQPVFLSMGVWVCSLTTLKLMIADTWNLVEWKRSIKKVLKLIYITWVYGEPRERGTKGRGGGQFWRKREEALGAEDILSLRVQSSTLLPFAFFFTENLYFGTPLSLKCRFEYRA